MWWAIGIGGGFLLGLVGGPFIRGPAVIAASIALIVWLHKRNFDRTNEYGVESYRNFGHLMAHKTVELFLSFVAWIGAIAGLLLCYPYFFIWFR
jgi:hypothetical protein